MLRVCGPGGCIGLANWTPDGLIGRLFKTPRPARAAAAGGEAAVPVERLVGGAIDVRRRGLEHPGDASGVQLPLPLAGALHREGVADRHRRVVGVWRFTQARVALIPSLNPLEARALPFAGSGLCWMAHRQDTPRHVVCSKLALRERLGETSCSAKAARRMLLRLRTTAVSSCAPPPPEANSPSSGALNGHRGES